MTKLFFGAITLLALTVPARANDIDCGSFPNSQARFSCYDALSRGPKVEAAPQAVRPPIERPPPKQRRFRKRSR